ncbi:hypothetical protein D3C78_1639680 [compost metagenome]
MIGLATDDGAQRDQGVEFKRFGHVGQGHAQFQGARDGGDHHVAFVHAELGQFLQARFEFGLTDFFVEAGAYDADVQPFAVQVGGKDVRVHVSAFSVLRECSEGRNRNL